MPDGDGTPASPQPPAGPLPTDNTVPGAARLAYRGSRGLAARIYLLSVASILVTCIALAILVRYGLEPPWKTSIPPIASYLASAVSERRGDMEAMRGQAARIRRDLGASLTLYDPAGAIVLTNVDPPLQPLDTAQVGRLAAEPTFMFGSPPQVTVAVADPRHPGSYALVRPPPPEVPAGDAALALGLVLACFAVGSVLFARSLASPLGHLTSVARRFGAGDLTVRSRLRRPNEIGELSRAFDDMADRVTHLIRAQTELIANVSHEFRTPLARIRMAVDLAEDGRVDRVRECLEDIAEDVAELEALVRDVLMAARLDLAHGRTPESDSALKPAAVSAEALVDRAAARFGRAHPERPLEVLAPRPLATVFVDAALVLRVLDNLLENAHKYSDPRTAIALRAQRIDGGVSVEVADRGMGIDRVDLAHVFTPFFRTDRSRARATGGVGLGLALARRIVEAHGGTIAIDSAVDVGTTVRFTLPVGRIDAAA